MDPLTIAVCLIVIALIFDFTNGFHDAANSIATVVATGTLKPRQAVMMAAFFNFIVMFFISNKVAATIGKGIVNPSVVTLPVIFACLMGAITWNIITWFYALPTSSSHALIGGLIGATLCKVGSFEPMMWENILRIGAFIVLSPVLGFVLGAGLNTAARAIWSGEQNGKKWKYAQMVSSALYSMGHGANDAQKTAGIIFLILVSSGLMPMNSSIPYWVIGLCHLVIGLGTLSGGWRIVKTLGYKLTKLDCKGGFCAETGGSMMLFAVSAFGIPVSTTHTITGSICGVGASETNPDVKWKLARKIVVAWFLTIPVSAIIAAAYFFGFGFGG